MINKLSSRTPFECDHEQCGKKFKHSSYLAKHKKTHDEDKPHKCNLCPKQYSEACELQRHLTTHSTERPFSCKFCERKFKNKAYMKKHVKQYHTDDVKNEINKNDRENSSVSGEIEMGEIFDVGENEDIDEEEEELFGF